MTTTQPVRPGEWFDTGMGLDDIDAGQFRMDISTDRYTDPEYVQRERDSFWLRVWQAAGRESELPDVVDSMSVYEFTAGNLIRRIDVYLQMELPSPELLQGYAGVEISR